MSTDYEIRCSCGCTYSWDNWRTPESVTALIGLRAHFAAIGKAIDLGQPTSARLDALYGYDAHGSMFPGAFHWFAAHEGHAMEVFDEYGRRWSEEYERRKNELYKEQRTATGAAAALIAAQLRDLDLEQEEAR